MTSPFRSLRSPAAALAFALLLGASSSRAAVTVVPTQAPRATADSFYSLAISATGGVAPYTYAVTTGALPPWATTTAPFTISGTPTTSGQWTFEVTATDNVGASGSRSYTIGAEERWSILVGSGSAQPNPNQVRAFDRDGNSTATNFLAYGAGQWGTHVASGNIDGGADWEILTAPGPGAVYGPQIRGFKRDGTGMGKVNFYAYGTLKFGANVAAGDLDGDGYDEILTAPGPGAVFGPHVRGWNYDGTAISAIGKINFFAYSTLKYGVNIACGDVDGDLYDEILTAPGPGAIFGPQIRGFNYDNSYVSSMSKLNFNAFTLPGYGANLAVGDVDNDHYDEIVVALGPGPSHPSRFLGFDYDGVAVSLLPGYDVTPFATSYGGVPGLADVADPAGAIPGGEDLLAAPGPDPAAQSLIAIYAYTGTSLIYVTPPSPIIAFSGQAYGCNVAGGKLGL